MTSAIFGKEPALVSETGKVLPKRKNTSRQRTNTGEQNWPTSKRGPKTKGENFSEESKQVKVSGTETLFFFFPEAREHFWSRINRKWPESAAQICGPLLEELSHT